LQLGLAIDPGSDRARKLVETWPPDYATIDAELCVDLTQARPAVPPAEVGLAPLRAASGTASVARNLF
jgi:hypothetical protein